MLLQLNQSSKDYPAAISPEKGPLHLFRRGAYHRGGCRVGYYRAMKPTQEVQEKGTAALFRSE